MRMGKSGGGLDLAQEAVGAECIREVGVNHLEGHPPPVLQVVGEVNRSHSAAPELAIERIAASQEALEAVRQVSRAGVGHRHVPGILRRRTVVDQGRKSATTPTPL
jgi:hypothetical protein